MENEQIRQAVQNNVLWCDAVCRSHGRPGEFLDGMWLNRHETPPFYPNAVTLAKERTIAQMAYIHDLIEAGIAGEWGVKDSFCMLDLTPLGFHHVFEGEWIYRKASSLGPVKHTAGVRWARITQETELAQWEAAWRGDPSDAPGSTHRRIFLPSLLANETIAVIAAFQGQRIVAGAIASHTGEVVGISNLFVPASDPGDFRAGCVTEVINTFPNLPMVGYEAGRELAEMQALGFEAISPLRIWVRQEK